jgi:hypothetical protein
MLSMAKSSIVSCSAADTQYFNQRTEGGVAMEEVVVTNMVRSLKSLTLLIDCHSICRQGCGLIL